jgi:hypothetical protein
VDAQLQVKYEKSFNTLLSAIMLHKCFVTRLWYDSPYVFKQFTRIGIGLSQHLVNNGIASFADALKHDVAYLDRVLNRAGYGAQVRDAVRSLPNFTIEFALVKQERDRIVLNVACTMTNWESLKASDLLGASNPIMFVAGDMHDNLIGNQRLK